MRLDKLMLVKGLVETRAKARGLIMAGRVRVAGHAVDKAGALVSADADVDILAGMDFVGRGGLKLESALEGMRVDVNGLVCADVGASTGGFTDCMLQRGAKRVYAIDVGKGVLHWKLRSHPRVVVMEKTNARYLHRLPEQVGLVTIDASFISLRLLLPVALGWLQPSSGRVLALIKPQFEAGRAQVGKGGVVRSVRVHRQVLQDVLAFALEIGLRPGGLRRSPLRGAAGNAEFLALLTQSDRGCSIEELVGEVVPETSE
ncbi:MAG: TlyA family RNA methyltransferase [Anaerolineales bacterium]|nr:TlyA family RNA methyltransferase [Anaerolineales bacterium]